MGFGTVTSTSLINIDVGAVVGTLIANSPQLLISFLYLNCNFILTAMVMSAEWNDFAFKRKGLRVSAPMPNTEQRSTYWLSLPYRYSVPLMLCSTSLHYFISQSFFYVRIITFSDGKKADLISTCGYSLIAIIFALSVGVVIVLTISGLSLRPINSRMPVAGSCSAAISAACHPPPEDVDPHLKKVMWGEIVELTMKDMHKVEKSGTVKRKPVPSEALSPKISPHHSRAVSTYSMMGTSYNSGFNLVESRNADAEDEDRKGNEHNEAQMQSLISPAEASAFEMTSLVSRSSHDGDGGDDEDDTSTHSTASLDTEVARCSFTSMEVLVPSYMKVYR